MEEAYRVGVTLALNGGTGKIVQKLIEDFNSLDKVIQKTNGSLNNLVQGMRTLRREAEGTAAALKGAASAMERAARSRGQGGSVPTDRRGTNVPYAPYGGGVPDQSGRRALGWDGPYPALTGPRTNALVPYRSGGRDYALQGGPYTPYGGYGQSAPGRSVPGALVPYSGGGGGPRGPGTGFTLNGDPYGPPSDGALVPYQGRGERGPIPLNYRPEPADPQARQRSHGHRDWHTAGLELGVPAWMGGEFLKSTFEAGADLQDWQHRLLAQGFSSDQVKDATAKAFKLQRDIRPTRVTGNMKLLSELMSVVQNPQESLEMLPEWAKLQVQYARAGDEHGADDMLSAMKAGEYRGVLQTVVDPKTGDKKIDQEALKRFLHNLLATKVITGGTITGGAVLQFLRSSGYAGANISDETLFARNIALMQALGPSGAGTALKGLITQFGGGKMSQGAGNLLLEMGILQGGPDVKHNKWMRPVGIGHIFVKPQAFPPGVQMEASENPDKFINQYLFPKIQTYLAKELGATYSKASRHDQGIMELNYAGQIASRDPGAKDIAESIRVKGLMDRDTDAWKLAIQRPIEKDLTEGNPKISAGALVASWDAFKTALGDAAMKPAVELLDALTKDLNALSEWARKNPDGAEKAMKGLAAGVALLGGGAALSAAMALATGPASLFVLASGIEAFGHGLTSFPSWLVNMAAGAAAGAKFGVPGAVAGAAGGALWNSGPGGLNNVGWSPLHPFSLSHTGPDGQLHYSWENQASAAPVASMQNQGARNTPLRVHVDNIGDMAHATGQGLAHSMNTPQQGITGYDPSTSDLTGLWMGAGPLAQ